MSAAAFKSSDLPFELLFVGLTHKLCHNVAPTSLNHHWITCFQSKCLELEVRRYDLGNLAIFDHPLNHLLSLTWLH